jgi:hypothetical protein
MVDFEHPHVTPAMTVRIGIEAGTQNHILACSPADSLRQRVLRVSAATDELASERAHQRRLMLGQSGLQLGFAFPSQDAQRKPVLENQGAVEQLMRGTTFGGALCRGTRLALAQACGVWFFHRNSSGHLRRLGRAKR